MSSGFLSSGFLSSGFLSGGLADGGLLARAVVRGSIVGEVELRHCGDLLSMVFDSRWGGRVSIA
jgi:hypothetical protein